MFNIFDFLVDCKCILCFGIVSERRKASAAVWKEILGFAYTVAYSVASSCALRMKDVNLEVLRSVVCGFLTPTGSDRLGTSRIDYGLIGRLFAETR